VALPPLRHEKAHICVFIMLKNFGLSWSTSKSCFLEIAAKQTKHDFGLGGPYRRIPLVLAVGEVGQCAPSRDPSAREQARNSALMRGVGAAYF
jgi:hypothetical protein